MDVLSQAAEVMIDFRTMSNDRSLIGRTLSRAKKAGS
jgi:hypothetical protein